MRRLGEDAKLSWCFPDYYHVKCFEQLANLSNRQFLNRLHPLTRKTAHMRAPEDVRDCLLDGGAEKLIVLWKIHRLKRIAVRKGEVYDASETDVDDLFYNAGAPDGFSGGEQYVGKKGVVSEAEYFLSLHQLAPSECEGADDPEPWNLFNSYLIATQKKTLSLAEQHCLSPMLESWERDVVSMSHVLDALQSRAVGLPCPSKGCSTVQAGLVLVVTSILLSRYHLLS